MGIIIRYNSFKLFSFVSLKQYTIGYKALEGACSASRRGCCRQQAWLLQQADQVKAASRQGLCT
jgi:hypothetical protein